MNKPQKAAGRIIQVKKASGETEEFSLEKLERSLRNAGAGNQLTEEILTDIQDWIYEGITTKKIYNRAFALLHRESVRSGLRYKLKQAIMELGPTGYPFEKLIGKIFEKQGFLVQVGQILDGHCVTHEVDVIATGNRTQYLMECKYSQEQGKPVSVQVPLYVRSRMDDIIRKRQEMPEYQGFFFTGWVVTNTKFTPDSIKFGLCSGLKLLSWDFPEGSGLKDLIERQGVYPLTVISQLTRKDKLALIDQGVITCSQLLEKKEMLDLLELSKNKLAAVIRELEEIC